MARPDVLTCDVGADGAVLLDPRADVYLGVEGTAALVWATLTRGPASIADLCGAVEADYDISADACEADVRTFLDDLLRRELITLVPQGDAPHGA